MKRLKEFLDFIVSLVQALPYIWGFLVLAVAVIIGLATNIESTTVHVSLSLPLVIALIALAIYPVAKSVEWLFKARSAPPFPYNGLMWKPAWFGFGKPTPFCPVPNCSFEVHHRSEQNLSIRPVSGYGPMLQTRTNDMHYYVCPIHGKVAQNEYEEDELRKMAKSVQAK